jgi:hypothetical protein
MASWERFYQEMEMVNEGKYGHDKEKDDEGLNNV